MNVFEILKNNIFLVFIIILPILCFITRKISQPLYSIPFFELNDNSFFGIGKVNIKSNPSEQWIYNIEDIYNNTRLFIETKYNKIILCFTFSKDKYYDDYDLSFYVTLNINETFLTMDNNSIIYSEYFHNNSNLIKISDNNIGVIRYLFSGKKIISLNNISLEYNKNDSNIKSELLFDDFNLTINLKKEKLTYKFFYLLQNGITLVIHTMFYGIHFWEYNYQNINIIFIFVVFAKIISENMLIDLLKVSFPVIKIFIFYFHLLIYGEFILSISDLVTIIFIAFMICITISYFCTVVELYTNFYYCFNNKIVNNKIVIKNTKIISIFRVKILIFILILYNIFFNSIYKQAIVLILTLIFTIYQHLNKREVMHKDNIAFCIWFYTYGILIYLYHLFIYNLGKYYRIKPIYSILPFILIIFLYIILNRVIINGYKFTYVMEKDFERLKILDKECCSICLKNFYFNKNKINKIFCKVTQDENIHETPCNHHFHERCLFNWRKYKNICPVCRKTLPIPSYFYFYDETPCIYKPDWL